MGPAPRPPLLWAVVAVVGVHLAAAAARRPAPARAGSPGEVATQRRHRAPGHDPAGRGGHRGGARGGARGGPAVYDLDRAWATSWSRASRQLFARLPRPAPATRGEAWPLRPACAGRADASRSWSAECSPGSSAPWSRCPGQVYRTRIVDDLARSSGAGRAGSCSATWRRTTEQPVSLGRVSGAIDLRSGLEDELRTRLLEQDAVARRWIKPTIEFLAGESRAQPGVQPRRDRAAGAGCRRAGLHGVARLPPRPGADPAGRHGDPRRGIDPSPDQR